MEERYEMFYQSKYKELQLVVTPGRKKEINGEIIEVDGKYIKFVNFRYIPDPENIEEIKIMDRITSKSAGEIWKVTIAEQKLANEFRSKRDKLNDDYAEQLKFMKKISRPKDGKSIVVGSINAGEK